MADTKDVCAVISLEHLVSNETAEGLDEEGANDNDADDRMAIACHKLCVYVSDALYRWNQLLYLISVNCDPNSQTEARKGEQVSKGLKASMHPDLATIVEQAEHCCTQGEEHCKRQTHEDSMCDGAIIHTGGLCACSG